MNNRTTRNGCAQPHAAVPPLSEDDAAALAQYQRRSQSIRDLVIGCVRGAQVGAHIDGPPGVSKSYTVKDTLEWLKASYFVHQRITAQPLFYELRKHPDAVHIIEDCEGLFRQSNARTVLRSALNSERVSGLRERWVVWAVSGWKPREERFIFWGSLIFTSNRALNDADPEVRAIMSRIPSIHFAPKDSELKALMRSIARKGFDCEAGRISPLECIEIIEHVIQVAAGLQCPLDLRWVEHAYGHYLIEADHGGGVDWREQVRFHMLRTITSFERPVTIESGQIRGHDGKGKVSREERLACVQHCLQTFETDAERVEYFMRETGWSRPTFYRDLQYIRRGI
jgi:hypothetical protein